MQSIRGFRDLLGADFDKIDKISSVCREMAAQYNYGGIELPILEYTSIFKRTLGEASDIVNKEMFTFPDRNDELLTLRPEGTASTVRALISNKLTQEMPQKFFYEGPMFRYERPQKGRYRQFYQFGIECFGLDHPYSDAEVILMAIQITEKLGIKGCTLEINTIGDFESRKNYNNALREYFGKHEHALSEDSKVRLKHNPLRILDSKDQHDQKLAKDAPKFKEYLSKDALTYFEQVCSFLESFDIKYTHNPHLVRGLDYYCHTAFEIKSDSLGAQDTIIAGGRYNGMVAHMGGPDVSGIGWALGMDRVALILDEIAKKEPIIVIPMEESCLTYAMQTANQLRAHGKIAEISFRKKIGKDLKFAERQNAKHVILIGEDELKSETLTIKHLGSTKENETIKIDQLISAL